jgi:hypothetical protein
LVTEEINSRFVDTEFEFLVRRKDITYKRFNGDGWKHRVLFKDKFVYVDNQVVRTDVCNLCRAVKPFDCSVTHLHHEQYHTDNPLKDTIEVCINCHGKITEPIKGRKSWKWKPTHGRYRKKI